MTDQMIDKPILSYSQYRLAGYLRPFMQWWQSNYRVLSFPILVWHAAKDPFIVVHAFVVSLAPLLGFFLLILRLTRESLGAILFFPLVFLPLAVIALLKGRNRSTKDLNGLALVTMSTIEVDIRIEKYRRTFLEAGFDVLILGVSETSQRECRLEGPFKQIKVPYEHHKMSGYWRVEQFFELLKSNCAIYHANDLTSLVICYYAAVVTGAKLVFDAHEVWAENVSYDLDSNAYVGYAGWKKALLIIVEKFYARRADVFITVNNEIADRYEKNYGLRVPVTVIKNVPTRDIFMNRKLPSQPLLSVPENSFLIGYIGGLGPSRNIEGVIRALQFTANNVHFEIMGPGADRFKSDYMNLAANLGVTDRVHVREGVPMSEVFAHMEILDAGIAMLENLCVNFYLFLPNKIFEYMASGIPVLISDFPVVRSIVQGENIGFTFDPSDPKSIARAITNLQSLPPEKRREMGARALRVAREKYYWEREIEPLVSTYRSLTESVKSIS